jgi:hypothetical protein
MATGTTEKTEMTTRSRRDLRMVQERGTFLSSRIEVPFKGGQTKAAHSNNTYPAEGPAWPSDGAIPARQHPNKALELTRLTVRPAQM